MRLYLALIGNSQMPTFAGNSPIILDHFGPNSAANRFSGQIPLWAPVWGFWA